MLILTGPAGSGKTFLALQQLREAIRLHDDSVRLLVPTATMAAHLRNELAREGLVVRPSLIQTLWRFIERWVSDLPQISDPAYALLVERTVRRLNLPAFAKVADFGGFHAMLVRTLEELSTAGLDSAALEKYLTTTLGEALVKVHREVSCAISAKHLGSRSDRLRLAAERIGKGETAELKTVWLDGFFSLTDPELELVKALAAHAEVIVTLPDDEIASTTRGRLLAAGFAEKSLKRRREVPSRQLVVAPSLEREADEIARQIVEQNRAGRPFREIGIIIRSGDVYVPVLRSTLERFGIPARFYFGGELMEHAVVRYLAGAVDVMLGGWDYSETLAVMKLAPGAGTSAPMDRFDFAVRQRIPGCGLDALRKIADELPYPDQRVVRLLADLSALESWRALKLKPAEWTRSLASLRALHKTQRPREAAGHEAALTWRTQALALQAFDSALFEAALSFDSAAAMPLSDYWSTAKAVLKLQPLRVPDHRRDVVHVLSVHEARQWELPLVFVCGLVEGQFPRFHRPDPLLPEHARRRLKENGLRIRSAEDTEKEEKFLFDSAMTRATRALVLSYPKTDSRGEQNLRSLYLDLAEPAVRARPVRVRPVRTQAPGAPIMIRSSELLQVIATRHADVRPTALESFLQCPFQFFGRHTLKLEEPPLRPDQRLDFRMRGKIVHQTIAEWVNTKLPIEGIFDRIFHEGVAEKNFPVGYQTELLRAQMLEDLMHFAESDRWPADFESKTEEAFTCALVDGFSIHGRIDRLLKAPDGRGFIVDYKYSDKLKDKLENQNLLQGPLYALALERAFGLRPGGMFYCAMRKGFQYGGWGEQMENMNAASVLPLTSEWLQAGVERSVRAAGEITKGQIEPFPNDPRICPRCEFRDVCRFAGAGEALETAALETAEGA